MALLAGAGSPSGRRVPSRGTNRAYTAPNDRSTAETPGHVVAAAVLDLLKVVGFA
jgi:hypothetical protein